jgi:hypothetical protein
MASEAQNTANRLNAQASTGPRSPEGKSRVAQNSVKLGLFSARDLVLPEEQSEYDELRAALEAELLPATVMERTLAMEILHATWRLRRCALTEAGLVPTTPKRWMRLRPQSTAPERTPATISTEPPPTSRASRPNAISEPGSRPKLPKPSSAIRP